MKISRQTAQTLVFFGGIPLVVLLILRCIGFDGLYGQDSYEYLRYTNAIQTYITSGKHPNSFYWPVLYPLLGSLIGFFVGSTAFAMQLIACLSLSIFGIYTFKTLNILYPKCYNTNRIYVLLFGILSPYFLKAGLVVMSDVTASMFITLSLYFFLKAYKLQTRFVLSLFFISCAIMTRYAALIIVCPIGLLSVLIIYKRKQFKDLFLGIFFSMLICIPFLILQWHHLFGATSNYFFNAWSFSNFFSSFYETIDGVQNYNFPNIAFVFSIFIHPGFISIGFVLSVFFISKRKNIHGTPQLLFLTSSLLYLVFLAGIPFQNYRVVSLVFPVILLLLYPAFLTLIQLKYFEKFKHSLTLSFVVIQFFLWGVTFKNVYRRVSFEKEVYTHLKNYQGKKLYSFDIDVALQGRGLNFIYKNMYLDFYNDFNTNDLVLFHPTLFSKQWQNHNVMLNWEFMTTNYNLEILESLPLGWKLYKIK